MFEIFHSSANHARFHGAKIVDLNCKLLAGLAQEYRETSLRTFRAHVHCFYSFATKTVKETLAVVSLVYDSLLQRTTTYLQQWSWGLHWLGKHASSFPHSCTHTETCFNTFNQVSTRTTVRNKAELLFFFSVKRPLEQTVHRLNLGSGDIDGNTYRVLKFLNGSRCLQIFNFYWGIHCIDMNKYNVSCKIYFDLMNPSHKLLWSFHGNMLQVKISLPAVLTPNTSKVHSLGTVKTVKSTANAFRTQNVGGLLIQVLLLNSSQKVIFV
jgi:hypothetical protein